MWILGVETDARDCPPARFRSRLVPAALAFWKARPLSAYIKDHVLITTSGWYQPAALICAITAAGAEHILFADDSPWVETELAVKKFQQTPMNDGDRDKIYHQNAERWLMP